jgi:U3 small nucleolar RNA-associated protein 23
VITQCSMRHLYASAKEPGVSYLIDKAKTYERRRCNHLPEDYPEPLSTKECLSSVVDPKGSGTNKHRYCVASQDLETRKFMRGVLGVPLVYISRSVMIMEPMAEKTVGNREREERGKFRDGLKRGSGALKRKREEGAEDGETQKKKAIKGPKGPNPLAVKKSKKKAEGEGITSVPSKESERNEVGGESITMQIEGAEGGAKRKRRRKHKPVGDGSSTAMTEPADDSN